jgi:hypothetical protein
VGSIRRFAARAMLELNCSSSGMQVTNGLSSGIGFESEILTALGMEAIIWTIDCTPLLQLPRSFWSF